MPATRDQLIRLHTLYSQLAARDFELDKTRNCRMRWASRVTGRAVASFNDLTKAEAKQLIDSAQQALGIAETTPPLQRRATRRANQNLGTAGRRDQVNPETTLLDGTEDVFSQILAYMAELEMDEAGLKRFLRSSSGPNQRRDTIRTLADANRVRFALKGIADSNRRRNERASKQRHPTAEVAA